jgi:hypothetical protein
VPSRSVIARRNNEGMTRPGLRYLVTRHRPQGRRHQVQSHHHDLKVDIHRKGGLVVVVGATETPIPVSLITDEPNPNLGPRGSSTIPITRLEPILNFSGGEVTATHCLVSRLLKILNHSSKQSGPHEVRTEVEGVVLASQDVAVRRVDFLSATIHHLLFQPAGQPFPCQWQCPFRHR